MTQQCAEKQRIESPPPKITPEIAKQLAAESHELRKEFEQRVVKMWAITPDERQTRSR